MTQKKAAAPAHPKYCDMITAALVQLKDRKGTSRQAISKYIQENYKLGANCNTQLRMALKRGVSSGLFTHASGTGASGSFKLVKKEAAPAAKKKPAANKPLKKPKTKTAAKKPKPSSPKKKSAAKKSTPKKAPAKKTPTKKAAAKKSNTKKSPAKKVASKGKKATPKPKKAGAKKVAKK